MSQPSDPPPSASAMDSLPRKRKGFKSAAAAGSHLSDGDRRCKRKCGAAISPGPSSPWATAGVVMTAPPSGRACSPTRGLKRKHGCLDLETRLGRRKRLHLHYTVGELLGKGKFGSVNSCRSRVTGVEYACKSLAKTDDTVHKEVEIMQHLSGHPGVVTIKAVFEEKDFYHLVMEICSGGRLLDKMKDGRFSEERAARVVKELVDVLKYCHEMGVVHRDVKPENILLTAMGSVKLADFGLAVRVTKGQRLYGVAGSPAYVAPEVLSGHYTEKVDVWGAGVLLHALLVGALPFQGNSLEAVFESIKKTDLNFCYGMWESISEPARDLVSKMLTRDVDTRLTADQVLGHPWILSHTECPLKASHTEVGVNNNNGMTKQSSPLLPTEERVLNNQGTIKEFTSVLPNTVRAEGQNNQGMTQGFVSVFHTKLRVENYSGSTKGSSSLLPTKLRVENISGVTEGSSSVLPTKVRVQNNSEPRKGSSSLLPTKARVENHVMTKRPLSLESSTWEEEQQCSFVDALAEAISRMKISGPKRSRLCAPASPIQQELPSNMKANLCTAAF